MVPPASEPHQRLGSELLMVLFPLAREAGLHCRYEAGLFDPDRPDRSWRVPDLIVFAEHHRQHRGAVGAELVVEILSPDDESVQKLPFYERLGVGEVLFVDPDSARVTLRRFSRDGTYRCVAKGADGGVRLRSVPLRLAPVDGGLRVSWPDGERVVPFGASPHPAVEASRTGQRR